MFIYTYSGSKVIIDDEDYDKVKLFKWHDKKRHGVVNGIIKNGTPRVLSHLLLDVPKGMVVDHINGDVLDNKKQNLRIVTHQQNLQNKQLYKNNKSGFKGVYWCLYKKKWVARIIHNKKRIYIGSYCTAESASKAYQKEAIERFKEFVRK